MNLDSTWGRGVCIYLSESGVFSTKLSSSLFSSKWHKCLLSGVSVLTSTFPNNEPKCLEDSGHRKHLVSSPGKYAIPELLPTLGSSLVLSPRRQATLLPPPSLCNAYADEMTRCWCSHACSGVASQLIPDDIIQKEDRSLKHWLSSINNLTWYDIRLVNMLN